MLVYGMKDCELWVASGFEGDLISKSANWLFFHSAYFDVPNKRKTPDVGENWYRYVITFCKLWNHVIEGQTNEDCKSFKNKFFFFFLI